MAKRRVAPPAPGSRAPKELLTILNAHRSTDGGRNMPPAPSEDHFVAYATNAHGEQMLIIGDRERLELYHGDYAWQPIEIVGGKVKMIAGDEERRWFKAVWKLWRAGLGRGA